MKWMQKLSIAGRTCSGVSLVVQRMHIGAAMLRTKGYTMIHMPELGAGASDRSDLIMPGLILEDPTSLAERQRVAQLTLDMFWQGFGYASCPFINDNGTWGAG